VIKSEEDELGAHVARVGEMRKVTKNMVVKPEGKRQVIRPRRIWEDNIRMDRVEIGWGDLDCLLLRNGIGGGIFVNTVIKPRDP
jgi:hypothetical protein